MTPVLAVQERNSKSVTAHNMKKIATHNAKFHTDDVFAVATLFLVLGKENCEVLRTRDEAVISSSDYVVDVGGIYDESKNRFDHHQAGGAGERENGIPYASFGLVWRAFGEKLSGSKEVADDIDRILAQPIDAGDNGKDLFTLTPPEVSPYLVGNIVSLYRSTWKEEEDWDKRFMECVEWAQNVIKRQIKVAQDFAEGAEIVRMTYEVSPDKRLVIFDEKYSLGRELIVKNLVSFPEPLYSVFKRNDHKAWKVVAVRKNVASFELRKRLPESWGAKNGPELVKETGVTDAIFCHRGGFMCVAESKEGALTLAQKALNA